MNYECNGEKIPVASLTQCSKLLCDLIKCHCNDLTVELEMQANEY